MWVENVSGQRRVAVTVKVTKTATNVATAMARETTVGPAVRGTARTTITGDNKHPA